MKHMLLAIASLALASCLAADAPYTCYLRVGTQEAERKTDTSGGRGGRRRGGRGGRGRGRGNVSTNTRTSTSGTRVTGCIIQLVVKGKVEGSFASNSRWSRLAKEDPVDTEEVLKML